MIAKIFINKQIGNSYDKQGSITERGVELQDVIAEVEANKGAEMTFVYIHSGGGDLEKGKAIAKYISSLTNCYTVADTMCGSAATEIALAVPVSHRKIFEDSDYFIHNPLLEGVKGDAETLDKASSFVKTYEKEMLAMYVTNTTASKEALQGLMKQETALTPDQCLTLGFVSEIIPREKLKPIAFINTKTDKNDTDMTLEDIQKAVKAGVTAMKAELKAELKAEQVVAMVVTTDKGELTYSSEGELPTVDEVVMIGEEIAPEGSYTAGNGAVITVVAEGIVSEVVPAAVEATAEELKAEVETLKAENKTLKEGDKGPSSEEVAELIAKAVKDTKEEIKSTFVPQAAAPRHSKKTGGPAKSFKERAAASREAYKKN